MTRSDVEWLKQDSKKTLERAKALSDSPVETPAFSSLAEGSINKEELLEAERFTRQLWLARELTLVVNGALNKSKWCGVFLGELIPFLSRKEAGLMANEHFKRRISELRSAQKSRKEGRTLRTEIEDIIREARSRRHFHNMSKGEHLVREARNDMRDLGRRAKLLKKEEFDLSSRWLENLRQRANAATKAGDLARLPEFSTLSADEWFEKVVWPELQRIAARLRSNPLIGELKKANKSGKFQLSDLKTQARATVVRIAALPRSFYFA